MDRRASGGAQNETKSQGQDQGPVTEKHEMTSKGRFWNRPKTNPGGKGGIKMEAEEETKTPNHQFKTGQKNQNKLQLGECSRGCGSETESQLLKPDAYFCHLFQRTLM